MLQALQPWKLLLQAPYLLKQDALQTYSQHLWSLQFYLIISIFSFVQLQVSIYPFLPQAHSNLT